MIKNLQRNTERKLIRFSYKLAYCIISSRFKKTIAHPTLILKTSPFQAAFRLLDRIPGLKEKCTDPISSLKLFCRGISKKESVHVS